MIKKVSYTVLLIAGLVVPLNAEASADGYVCSVAHINYPNGTFGSEGYLTADYTTLPFCEGDYIGARNYCSSGGTHAVCAPSYRYSGVALAGLAQRLQKAAVDGTKVTEISTSNQGHYVRFYGE